MLYERVFLCVPCRTHTRHTHPAPSTCINLFMEKDPFYLVENEGEGSGAIRTILFAGLRCGAIHVVEAMFFLTKATLRWLR